MIKAADRFEDIKWQEANERWELCLGAMLGERELPSRIDPPQRDLPFCPELHAEIIKLWDKPYSAKCITPRMTNYSSDEGLNEKACKVMPQVEEELVHHLRLGTQTADVPPLASKPSFVSSSLFCRAFLTAGQSVGCLHTTPMLQAYQANLLKEFIDGGGATPKRLWEALQASHLALRATKEAATNIGRSMAATERHLWLTRAKVKEADKTMDAPIQAG